MKIVEYIKSHPWTVGALVIGGGVVFIVLSGMGRASDTTVVAADTGPSEEAQLGFASLQLQGQIANAQANAAIQQATLEAEVALELAGSQEAIALAQINANKDISMADVSAGRDMFTIQNQTARETAQLAAATQQHNTNASKEVELANINANKGIIESIIDAFKPTPPTPAPPPPPPTPTYRTVDPWEQLLVDRQDVLNEYYRASASVDRNSPVFKQKGLDSPTNFAKYWYNNMGGSNSYQLKYQVQV